MLLGNMAVWKDKISSLEKIWSPSYEKIVSKILQNRLFRVPTPKIPSITRGLLGINTVSTRCSMVGHRCVCRFNCSISLQDYSISDKFWGFRAILRLPVSLAWFFNAVWYRKYLQSRSGGRFLNISVWWNWWKCIFCQKLTFFKRIMRRFEHILPP